MRFRALDKLGITALDWWFKCSLYTSRLLMPPLNSSGIWSALANTLILPSVNTVPPWRGGPQWAAHRGQMLHIDLSANQTRRQISWRLSDLHFLAVPSKGLISRVNLMFLNKRTNANTKWGSRVPPRLFSFLFLWLVLSESGEVNTWFLTEN